VYFIVKYWFATPSFIQKTEEEEEEEKLSLFRKFVRMIISFCEKMLGKFERNLNSSSKQHNYKPNCSRGGRVKYGLSLSLHLV
jgi:hypothetical protein